jgi:hypothetical protein
MTHHVCFMGGPHSHCLLHDNTSKSTLKAVMSYMYDLHQVDSLGKYKIRIKVTHPGNPARLGAQDKLSLAFCWIACVGWNEIFATWPANWRRTWGCPAAVLAS